MTKVVELICKQCDCKFDKVKKEYDRQVRNGRDYFFCSLTCNTKCTNSKNNNLGNYLCDVSLLTLSNNGKDDLSPYKTYLRRCEQRKQHCDLTWFDLKTQFECQQGKCALTNVDLVLENKVSNPNYSASLDRIDSNKGYVKDNIQWVSVITNLAKNKYPIYIIEEYFSIIRETL